MPASVDVSKPELATGLARMQARIELLDGAGELARAGGGERQVERHRSRGKLFVRDRIAALVDEGTEPLELGELAAHGMYGGQVPSAGIVTVIGQVAGRTCMIIANDATVKGGTYFPPSVRR